MRRGDPGRVPSLRKSSSTRTVDQARLLLSTVRSASIRLPVHPFGAALDARLTRVIDRGRARTSRPALGLRRGLLGLRSPATRRAVGRVPPGRRLRPARVPLGAEGTDRRGVSATFVVQPQGRVVQMLPLDHASGSLNPREVRTSTDPVGWAGRKYAASWTPTSSSAGLTTACGPSSAPRSRSTSGPDQLSPPARC
jgi:hypothetical protein